MKLKKREINMLEGPLWNRILQYALPLVATGILQQLFNAADIAVVGRFTGEKGSAAMAAVGANTPVIGLILNAFIGISLGTNVVIANAVGRKDERSISRAVHTSVLLSLIGGVVLGVLAELLAVPILQSQNVPDEVLPMAMMYFRIYMAGMPVILLYNFEAAMFRGIGNTRTPLAVLAGSGVLNIGLNLLFVLGMHMTVEGVAIATVASNFASACVLLLYLLRTDTAIKVEVRKLRIDRYILRRILRIGVPAGIQGAVFSFANIIIQSAINSLGTIVMAASSAALNLEAFAYYVLNSFGQACTTFTGQNYGAGNYRRCRRIMGLCFLEGVIATAAAVFLILGFSHPLLSIFNTDPEVIRVGHDRLVYIFAAYIFSLSYEVMSGYMRGFGISLIPAVLTTAGICGVRITWIYAVFPHYRTFQNIMLVYPISLCTAAVLILMALLVLRPSSKLIRKQNIAERTGDGNLPGITKQETVSENRDIETS